MAPTSSRVCFYGYQDPLIDDVEIMVERAIEHNARNALITVPLESNYNRPDHQQPGGHLYYQPDIFSSRLWLPGSQLKIGFLAGTDWQRDQVKRYAPQWTQYGNISFIFLTDTDMASITPDILVGFDSSKGSWACRGTDCRYFSSRGHVSVNLGCILQQRSQVDTAATVLHQFGHVLGLVHEHASTRTLIPLIEERVHEDLGSPPSNWDEALIERICPTHHDHSSVQKPAFDSCSIMLKYYPHTWVKHGHCPRFNIAISELDKDYIRFYYPHQNPGIGNFNTLELTRNITHLPLYTKEISFQQKDQYLHGIIVGLHWFDTESSCTLRIRVKAVVKDQQTLTPSISTWADSAIYSAGISWLGVGPKLGFLQHGICTAELTAASPRPVNPTLVEFSTPFRTPPKVICFLQDIDMDSNDNWRIKAYPSDITPQSFKINIDPGAGTILHEASVGWLAYPAETVGVASGRIDTNDLRSWNDTQQHNASCTSFSKPFSKIPNVFVVLDSFDYDGDQNPRLRVSTSLVTPDGFNWSLQSWADSIMYQAGASWFAWED
ncbi:hypothetical protein MW887_009894 [Aspergillus wentii]|nr:hypothetical protein MW887_009894 [Aspergillus wentii]